MNDPTHPPHEIGSDIPPRAAEVEPPATNSVIPTGGSADIATTAEARSASPKYDRAEHDRIFAAGFQTAREKMNKHYGTAEQYERYRSESFATSPAAGMGVTGNAVILPGYLAGTVDRIGESARYRFVAGGAGGEAVVQHRDNGNTYRVSVVQLEGVE